MPFTSDNQERAIIEAHIQEAQELRAMYLAAALGNLVQWVSAAVTDIVEPVKVQLTRANMGGLGHAFKDEVLP